jgi:hypothetical protein
MHCWAAARPKPAPILRQLLIFFAATYGVKYDKAVGKLTKDRDVLPSFYDFAAEHWKHIRTTNPPSRACKHALPDNNRKHLRNAPASNGEDEGLPQPQNRPRHGFRVDDLSTEQMAQTGWCQPHA